MADITYCSTWEGWLYVAFVVDVYARVIVGWQIATHMRTDLVIDALDMAAWRRDPVDGCVHHCDAGSQNGFNRSSQHPDEGVVDGQAGWVDDGVNGAVGDAVSNTNLSGMQAQIELALPPNRGSPGVMVEIDVAGLRQAGYENS